MGKSAGLNRINSAPRAFSACATWSACGSKGWVKMRIIALPLTAANRCNLSAALRLIAADKYYSASRKVGMVSVSTGPDRDGHAGTRQRTGCETSRHYPQFLLRQFNG